MLKIFYFASFRSIALFPGVIVLSTSGDREAYNGVTRQFLVQ